MNPTQNILLLAFCAIFSLQAESAVVVVDEVSSSTTTTDEESNLHGTGWATAAHIPIDGEEEDGETDGDFTFASMYSEEKRRSILVGFDSAENEASFVRNRRQQRSGSAIVEHEYEYTKTVRMEVTEDEYQAMLAAQKAEDKDATGNGILYIEEDVLVRAAFPKPNPQAISQQKPQLEQSQEQSYLRDKTHRKLQERVSYGLDMVQGFDYIPPASEARQCQVKICIVDSGLHVNHYDIPYTRGSPYVDGEEFGLPSNQYWYNPNSRTDHGTGIAGIIAARGGNGAGTLGIVSQGPEASKVCLLNARIFADDDYTTTSGFVLQAAEWCANKGANIINLSLASPAATNSDRYTYQELYNRGILLIAAAGNSGTDEYNYPASLDSVISVGSIGQDRKQSGFSQTNNRIELVAPGHEIYSTSGDDMDFFTGTSFATPYVAGVAAKIWAAHPYCSNRQIREALQKSAQALGTNPVPTSRFGYGLIRARAANEYIQEKMYWPCGDVPVPSPGPTLPPTKQPTRHPTRGPTPGPTFPPQEGVSNPIESASPQVTEGDPDAHCQVELTYCDGDFTTLGDLSTQVSAAGVNITTATRVVRICCLGLSCQNMEGHKRGVCVGPNHFSSATTISGGSWWKSSFLVVPLCATARLILFGLV
ncbi:unnamed protein product [Cylindrotheca closterium]|uniref:subtilisin n=1 Tax=Cylindrotheca closterium TaxID=2856 RepID=A0AAD2FVQ5_9STRA|nr:unnamed protein product [Cylindrotheca closterium]